MEPGDDQQPVERAIEEEAEPAAFDDDAARAVDCAADMGIAIAHDHSEQQSGDSAGDRHEAPSAEESQIFRRSEEHTSELQSLMRISYAVFCLKNNNLQPPQQLTKLLTL